MQCENNFCIYWSEHACTLSQISLDTGGRCEECIMVNLDEKLLEAERQKLRWNLSGAL